MSRESRELSRIEKQRTEIAELRDLNSGLRRTQMTGAAAGIANELLVAARDWAESGGLEYRSDAEPFAGLDEAIHDGFRAAACHAGLQILGEKSVEEQVEIIDKATDDDTKRRIAIAGFTSLAYRQPEALLAALSESDRAELLKSVSADPRAIASVQRLVKQHELADSAAGKILEKFNQNGEITPYNIPAGTRILLDADIKRHEQTDRVQLKAVAINALGGLISLKETYLQPIDYDEPPFEKPFQLGRRVGAEQYFDAAFTPGARTETKYESDEGEDEFGTADWLYIGTVHRFVVDGYDILSDSDERFGITANTAE